MKKIELPLGLDVSNTYKYLSNKREEFQEHVMGSFNGKYVDSSMTEDEIYKSITGKSKEQVEKEKKRTLRKNKETKRRTFRKNSRTKKRIFTRSCYCILLQKRNV